MKKIFFIFLFLLTPVFSVLAKNDYIYRSRINWVKLDELSKKQLGGFTLKHPYTGVDEREMQAMLQSIQMNKGSALKSDIKTSEVFDIDEARKYAPLIVQALAKAAPNEVVNISLVHKRSKMVLRNDYLTMVNIFVTDDGVHFYFGKLFAKLEGDYMEVSSMNDTIRRAKNSRVSLSASEGQKLAFNSENEIILDPGYNFDSADESLAVQTGSVNKVQTLPKTKVATPTPEPSLSLDERLKKLADLKEQGLISEKEYKTRKKEILDEL